MATAMHLPLDIHLLILRQLTVSDLKTYSLCSKWHRDLVLPLLFRSLRLSPEAALGFGKGGSLAHLSSSVREVVLGDLTHPSDIARNIDRARMHCEALHLFPRVTALRVSVYVTPEFHFPLISAIFWKLAVLPFYSKIKSISLSVSVALASSPHYSNPILIQEKLSADGTEFIGQPAKLILYHTTEWANIPWPAALEEVSTSTLHTLRYVPTMMPYLTCHPVFENSFTTLRRIKITTATVYALFIALPTSLYPSVDEVWLSPSRCDGTCGVRPLFARVVAAFPSTRDLRLDMDEHTGTWYRRSDIVYTMLADLPKLQRARIPWPHDCSIDLVPHMLLQFSVRLWVKPNVPSTKSGLQNFRYVDFVAGSTWSKPEHAIYRVIKHANGEIDGTILPLQEVENEIRPFDE
ncbi:hypothetical protein Dda_6339 [Drechslerella dactyloides]|uniref:F-box domain-containing protein n=1 Tax=Drechslerella dactyloides TaxID=74499 RepID=A0AAD6IVC6_DREDA|nr:hypothetical protein Dda_6339 [Drechslerella dactyloides]